MLDVLIWILGFYIVISFIAGFLCMNMELLGKVKYHRIQNFVTGFFKWPKFIYLIGCLMLGYPDKIGR